MLPALLDRLDVWKTRYGAPDTTKLEDLLSGIAKRRLRDPALLIRLHETLLFLRAYPHTPRVARLTDDLLRTFAARIADLTAAGVDLEPFEAPEISGIAGTSLTAVFSYEVARRLAARHPRNIEIGWDRYTETDKLGPVLRRFLPLLDEDWPVEAHVPFRRWIQAACPRGNGELAWLLHRMAELPAPPRERADLYESLELPLSWQVESGRRSRSGERLPAAKLFCHTGPLLRRGDVSLARDLDGPPLPVRRVPRPESRRVLDLILDTSALRFRELYGFSHPDEARVYCASAGRGVEIYFFGVPPQWRLPLRAYHAGMFFKNGVPAGYIETLSLFERAEVGFNLYYTFREGESAWLYARLLRLFRQVLGVTCFSVDPYQIGLENPEAIDSGAFWFYRKLGFRPVDPRIAALTEREERKIRETPGYRSSKHTLERLAAGYILFEGPSAKPGAWDTFRIRNLALAATRAPGHLPLAMNAIPDLRDWSAEEQAAAERIVEAKYGPDEARYLRLMQRHEKLRSAFLALGSRETEH
jgi:hypothetical protein